MQAFVALGSNLTDPAAQVRAGMRALAALPATRVLACSSLYLTKPIGLREQPDFVNAVCKLETGLPAARLMQSLLEVEASCGRRRSEEQPGGPRTLDLDLLLYADETHESDALRVPHPRLHERAFVLYPLAEIEPDLVIPGRGRVATLLAACADQGIERLADQFSRHEHRA